MLDNFQHHPRASLRPYTGGLPVHQGFGLRSQRYSAWDFDVHRKARKTFWFFRNGASAVSPRTTVTSGIFRLWPGALPLQDFGMLPSSRGFTGLPLGASSRQTCGQGQQRPRTRRWPRIGETARSISNCPKIAPAARAPNTTVVRAEQQTVQHRLQWTTNKWTRWQRQGTPRRPKPAAAIGMLRRTQPHQHWLPDRDRSPMRSPCFVDTIHQGHSYL